MVPNRATTSLFVAAVLLALQVGSAHAGEKVEESEAELFKLIAPTIAILVSAVTLSAQLGGLKVRLETIEKAVETNRTELKADLNAVKTELKADLETVKKDLGEIKSNVTFLKGFRAGEEQKPRIFLR